MFNLYIINIRTFDVWNRNFSPSNTPANVPCTNCIISVSRGRDVCFASEWRERIDPSFLESRLSTVPRLFP